MNVIAAFVVAIVVVSGILWVAYLESRIKDLEDRVATLEAGR